MTSSSQQQASMPQAIKSVNTASPPHTHPVTTPENNPRHPETDSHTETDSSLDSQTATQSSDDKHPANNSENQTPEAETKDESQSHPSNTNEQSHSQETQSLDKSDKTDFSNEETNVQTGEYSSSLDNSESPRKCIEVPIGDIGDEEYMRKIDEEPVAGSPEWDLDDHVEQDGDDNMEEEEEQAPAPRQNAEHPSLSNVEFVLVPRNLLYPDADSFNEEDTNVTPQELAKLPCNALHLTDMYTNLMRQVEYQYGTRIQRLEGTVKILEDQIREMSPSFRESDKARIQDSQQDEM